ncbi:MAG TPA: hypothetical protein VES68_04150 [Candidatus Sulfotelmatobacter sp.]|nr:hypothetical protein [Candidatus Sulfotelmatobacter sp.]
MALSPELLLNDNLQTYEEFRAQVDRELYGIEQFPEKEVIFDAFKIEPVVIFESPTEPVREAPPAAA